MMDDIADHIASEATEMFAQLERILS